MAFTCLVMLSVKLYQEKRDTVIYGHAKMYALILLIYCIGFLVSQSSAALLVGSESKFGLYFLTPSTQIDFLFEHICIYICGICLQTASCEMKLLSFIAVFESVIMKWIALYIDTYFFDLHCSLNKTECGLVRIVWMGFVCRNIAFSLLAILKLKAAFSYTCGSRNDPEVKELYFPRSSSNDKELLEPLA